MADQKISQLTTIVTVDTASDLFPIVDTSAAETKKITPSALKTALALNNVDNTSDANKPISSATQTALDAKQATLVSGTNIKTVNNTSLLGSGNITIAGGGGTWGSITGTLSSQTDLQTALDGKVDENTAITGATKTKITYDAKGLVTAGADATTADIADSTNKRYVTDAQLTVIGNTSGTNTGDNATNSQYSGLATSKQDTLVSGTNIKTVNSTSLLGSGDVAVQATLVSGTNIKTINSTSLLGSGDITISANPSGVSGAIQFSNGSAFASDAANLFFDDTNNRLGVGTNAPSATGHFKGSGSTSATTSLLVQNSAGNESFSIKDNGSIVFHTGVIDITSTRLISVSNDWTLGSFAQLGARLGIKGTGSTSATTSLLVQNSGGTELAKFNDDGSISFGSKMSISTIGTINTGGNVYALGGASVQVASTGNFRFVNASQIWSDADGTIRLGNWADNGFTMLRLGGSTSSFPSIKRASNNIEIKNADDTFGAGLSVGASLNASAILQADSTIKGFLPPRMTTTQKNAIATPAAGLVVYDTTLAKLCVYTTTWETITSL